MVRKCLLVRLKVYLFGRLCESMLEKMFCVVLLMWWIGGVCFMSVMVKVLVVLMFSGFVKRMMGFLK